MLIKLAIAFSLLALTVTIHASGLALLMRKLPPAHTLDDARFLHRTWLLIRPAAWAVSIHCLEIEVWAGFYWWQNCLPDWESSLYFAIVTYTAVSYGDLVLQPEWRILAGIEGLTGIIMCGWSTAFFFAFVSRMYTPSLDRKT